MITKFSHGAFKHRNNVAHDVIEQIFNYGYVPIFKRSWPKPAITSPKDYACDPEPQRGRFHRFARAVKNFFTRKT